MRFPLSIFAAVMLSACIDADVSLDFADGETAQVNVEMTLARQLFDMLGKSEAEACNGGDSVLTKTEFSCRYEKKMTVAELLENGVGDANGGDFDPSSTAIVERLDDNSVRVSFDFATMLNNSQKTEDKDLGGMKDMVAAAMAGHSFTFNVKGHKILSTTGTMSADGKQASRVIPVALFLDEAPDLGPAFVTDVQLTAACRFWVFCD